MYAYAFVVDVLEAIGDTNRRRIVELVVAQELSAGEIAAHFDISRPAISQHLAVLASAGALRVRQDGRRRLYSLEPAALSEVSNWLEVQRSRWEHALDALERAMEDEDE